MSGDVLQRYVDAKSGERNEAGEPFSTASYTSLSRISNPSNRSIK
jgi:hypothetical protein